MPKCRGNDPTCPCQDGDACHYETVDGSPAMPISDRAEQDEHDGIRHVEPDVFEGDTLLGVHRDPPV